MKVAQCGTLTEEVMLLGDDEAVHVVNETISKAEKYFADEVPNLTEAKRETPTVTAFVDRLKAESATRPKMDLRACSSHAFWQRHEVRAPLLPQQCFNRASPSPTTPPLWPTP